MSTYEIVTYEKAAGTALDSY